MRNSSIVLYLGCATLMVGSIGLTAGSMLNQVLPGEPGTAAHSQIAMDKVPPTPENRSPAAGTNPESWPAETATNAVAFLPEMIELLTPKAPVVARHEEEEEAVEPAPTQRQKRETVRDAAKRETARETTKRETVRDARKDTRQKVAAAKKREQPSQTTDPRQQEQAEVVVQDRFHRESYRSERDSYRGNERETHRSERATGRNQPETNRGEREPYRRQREAYRSERQDGRREPEPYRHERQARREPEIIREPQQRTFAPVPLPFFGSFFR